MSRITTGAMKVHPVRIGKMALTLSEFLNQDMARRGIVSRREYAKLIGCAASTIGEYINGAEPTIDFLKKLSKSTGVALRELILISYPEVAIPTDVDPQWILLYGYFKQLPQSVQDFIFRAMGLVE